MRRGDRDGMFYFVLIIVFSLGIGAISFSLLSAAKICKEYYPEINPVVCLFSREVRTGQ